MFKKVLFIFVLILLCADVFGQRRGDRGKVGFDRVYNPDEDYDYKVETTELRNWVSNVSRVYSYTRDWFRDNELVQMVSEFDKDNDRRLSTKEAHEFRNFMKPIFEKASKKLLLENDTNKNRRLDKSELAELRVKVPNFLKYALENEFEEKDAAAKKEPIPEKDPEKSRSISDIYD